MTHSCEWYTDETSLRNNVNCIVEFTIADDVAPFRAACAHLESVTVVDCTRNYVLLRGQRDAIEVLTKNLANATACFKNATISH